MKSGAHVLELMTGRSDALYDLRVIPVKLRGTSLAVTGRTGSFAPVEDDPAPTPVPSPAGTPEV